MRFAPAALIAAASILAACEGTDIERGAIGAAGGALAAKVTNNDVATGALIGGAAGVVCDDVTPQYCAE